MHLEWSARGLVPAQEALKNAIILARRCREEAALARERAARDRAFIKALPKGHAWGDLPAARAARADTEAQHLEWLASQHDAKAARITATMQQQAAE